MRYGIDILQVSPSILASRRAYGDEYHFRRRERFFEAFAKA